MWIDVIVLTVLSAITVVLLRSIDKDTEYERNKWGDE